MKDKEKNLQVLGEEDFHVDGDLAEQFEQENPNAEIEQINLDDSNQLVVFSQVENTKKKGKCKKDGDLDEFSDLARLLGTSVEKVKDDCLLYQVRKIMNNVSKVVVRYNVSDAKLEKIVLNTYALDGRGLIVTPVYLDSLAKIVKKHELESLPVHALIDFPFGESDFRTKITDVKNSVRKGVDGVTVMMPVVLTSQEKTKILKKQLKKLGNFCNVQVTIAFNASDIVEEDFIRTIKLCKKCKIKSIMLVFGACSTEVVKKTIKNINKIKKDIELTVNANVETAESVIDLVNNGVSAVCTPYADDIGKTLVKRFKIKGVKLV
jgi:deoxyribose-phosphate aldolase